MTGGATSVRQVYNARRAHRCPWPLLLLLFLFLLLYSLCAPDADTLSSSDAIHGERQRCSLRGHSSWVKTVQAPLS